MLAASRCREVLVQGTGRRWFSKEAEMRAGGMAAPMVGYGCYRNSLKNKLHDHKEPKLVFVECNNIITEKILNFLELIIVTVVVMEQK